MCVRAFFRTQVKRKALQRASVTGACLVEAVEGIVAFPMESLAMVVLAEASEEVIFFSPHAAVGEEKSGEE